MGAGSTVLKRHRGETRRWLCQQDQLASRQNESAGGQQTGAEHLCSAQGQTTLRGPQRGDPRDREGGASRRDRSVDGRVSGGSACLGSGAAGVAWWPPPHRSQKHPRPGVREPQRLLSNSWEARPLGRETGHCRLETGGLNLNCTAPDLWAPHPRAAPGSGVGGPGLCRGDTLGTPQRTTGEGVRRHQCWALSRAREAPQPQGRAGRGFRGASPHGRGRLSSELSKGWGLVQRVESGGLLRRTLEEGVTPGGRACRRRPYEFGPRKGQDVG